MWACGHPLTKGELLDPGGGFRSETAGHKYPFGCSGYVTAMAVGQKQRLYSGVIMFTGNYLTSTPRALRIGGAQLE
jgi:hypothetical protein